MSAFRHIGQTMQHQRAMAHYLPMAEQAKQERAAEKVGPVYRGLVIDQRTQEALARTATYTSAETAKSAAASMWRALQAQLAEAGVSA